VKMVRSWWLPSSGGFACELTLGECGADFSARQSERLKHAFAAEGRLLIELLVLTRVAFLLAFLARSPIVVHNW